MKFSTGPDGSMGVEFDIEQIVAQRWDSILGLFGKDVASTQLREWIKERTRDAIETASYVQIVGMHKPVLLQEIYQPTHLVVSGLTDIPSSDHISTPLAFPDLGGSQSAGHQQSSDKPRPSNLNSRASLSMGMSTLIPFI